MLVVVSVHFYQFCKSQILCVGEVTQFCPLFSPVALVPCMWPRSAGNILFASGSCLYCVISRCLSKCKYTFAPTKETSSSGKQL